MHRVLTCLAAATVALSAAPASANHTYNFGCTKNVVPDQQHLWYGALQLFATSNPPGATMTFECWVQVNGAQIVSPPVTASGTGVVVGAGFIQYVADPAAGDVVEICESAVVGGHQVALFCHP